MQKTSINPLVFGAVFILILVLGYAWIHSLRLELERILLYELVFIAFVFLVLKLHEAWHKYIESQQNNDSSIDTFNKELDEFKASINTSMACQKQELSKQIRELQPATSSKLDKILKSIETLSKQQDKTYDNNGKLIHTSHKEVPAELLALILAEIKQTTDH